MEFESLYPFESQFLERPSGRLHYVDEGEGHPVLMVHGNPTWSFYYRNLIQTLRSTQRCIALDHLGCGLSDKPDLDTYDYRLDSRIEDLEALVEHAIPEGPLDLVVHDWGGAIGFGWATQFAHRIRRIVVMNTAAFPNPKQMRLPFTLWLIRNTPLGQLLVQGGNAFAVGATRMAVKKPMPKSVKAGYVAPYDSWNNRLATYQFVKDIPLKPEDPGYGTLTRMADGLKQFSEIPTLVCWGGQDFVFDDDFLAAWQTYLPHAEVEYFPEAGHYVLEDESAAVCDRVQQFLGQ